MAACQGVLADGRRAQGVDGVGPARDYCNIYYIPVNNAEFGTCGSDGVTPVVVQNTAKSLHLPGLPVHTRLYRNKCTRVLWRKNKLPSRARASRCAGHSLWHPALGHSASDT